MEHTKRFGTPIAFSLLALASSVFARIKGYDFGYEASLASLGLLVFFYSLRFWNKEPKRQVDVARFVVMIVWSLHAFTVLNGMSFIGWTFFVLLAAIICWAVLEFIQSRKGVSSLSELHLFLLVGIAMELVGGIFKIQHWPGANFLLVIGVAIAGAGFIFNARPRVKG